MKKEGIQTRKRKQKNSGSGSTSNGTANEISSSSNPKTVKYSKSSSSSSSRKSAKLSSNGNLMAKLFDVQENTNLANHYGDGSFHTNPLEIIKNPENIQRSIIVNNNEK